MTLLDRTEGRDRGQLLAGEHRVEREAWPLKRGGGDERLDTRDPAPSEGGASNSSPVSSGAEIEPKTRRLITAKAWQRASAVRRQFFDDGDSLFADPAWEILLDLFIQHFEGRSVMVTDACFAAKVPPTTALRWLDRLHRSGLIERHVDAHDARRVQVSLTNDALGRLDAVLDEAIEGDRRLGLGRLQLI
jgi:hypothetical protein